MNERGQRTSPRPVEVMKARSPNDANGATGLWETLICGKTSHRVDFGRRATPILPARLVLQFSLSVVLSHCGASVEPDYDAPDMSALNHVFTNLLTVDKLKNTIRPHLKLLAT